jgi:hypothetical protein
MRTDTSNRTAVGSAAGPYAGPVLRAAPVPRVRSELEQVIAKTDFSFDGRTSQNQDVVLATGIDSRRWKSGVMVTRLHTKGTWSGTAILNIFVDNVSLHPVDPSVVFVGSRVAAPQILATASAPLLVVTGLTLAAIGPQLQVSLRWAQGATAAGAGQPFSLSIDLIGRPR